MNRTMYIFALLLSSLLFTQCGMDEQTVARIGDEKITVAELEDQLAIDYRQFKLSQITLEQKYQSLDKILEKRRMVLKAEQLKLDQDQEYAEPKARNDNREIAFALYQSEVIDKLMPESLIRDYYTWEKQKVSVAYIALGYQGAELFNRERPLEEARAVGEEYAQKLRSGADPVEEAKKVSDDSRNNPLLNPYYVGKFDPQVDRAVYTGSAGEVVGPIETHRGIIVLKILTREEQDVSIPFEEAKPRLERAIRRYFTRSEKEEFDTLSETFRTNYGFKIHDENLPEFFAALQAWGRDPESPLSDFDAAQLAMPLAEIDGSPFTGQNFANIYGEQLKRTLRKFSSVEDLKNILQAQLTMTAWAREGRKRGLDKTPDVKKAVDLYRLNSLEQMFVKHQIDSSEPISDEEVDEYYQANKERYKTPEKIRVHELSVNDEALAAQIAGKLRRKADFQTIFSEYKGKYPGKAISYTSGFRTRQSPNKTLVNQAFEAGPDKIIGPLPMNDMFVVIGTSDYFPEEIRPLDKLTNTIRAELHNSRREKRRQDLLEALKREFTHKVNDDAIRKIGQ